MEASREFLVALFTEQPPGHIQIWDKATKRSRYVAAPTAEFEGKVDHYVAAGLAPRPLGGGRRATAEQVVAIPGVWADLDVAGGPEGDSKKRAPSREAAIEVAESVLAPTYLVNSGYGVQAWWLFPEPWEIDKDRAKASALCEAWTRTIQHAALDAGWNVDSTFDLARLMRLPGTMNGKGAEPVPVEVIRNGGPRYALEQLLAKAGPLQRAAVSRRVEVTATYQPDADVPASKLEALRDNDPEFEQIWKRSWPNGRNWSASEWCGSLLFRAAHAGWEDQELLNLIVVYRAKHGDPPKDPGWYVREIAGCRTTIAADSRAAERERVEEAATGTLEIEADAVSPDSERTLAAFNALGAPEAKEVIQLGRDVDHTRYTMILADGREIDLGTAADLMKLSRVQQTFLVMTGDMLPNMSQAKWNRVVKAIVSVAVVREVSDGERDEALDVLRGYIGANLTTDRDGAVEQGYPFREDGFIYVRVATLLDHWRRSEGQPKRASGEVKQVLSRMGFESVKVPFGRTTRGYWRIAADALDLE